MSSFPPTWIVPLTHLQPSPKGIASSSAGTILTSKKNSASKELSGNGPSKLSPARRPQDKTKMSDQDNYSIAPGRIQMRIEEELGGAAIYAGSKAFVIKQRMVD